MKHKITIEFDDEKDSVYCGFRQQWLRGTSGKGKNKTELELKCGAGVGSPYLIFDKTQGNKSHTLVADIRDVIKQLDAIPFAKTK